MRLGTFDAVSQLAAAYTIALTGDMAGVPAEMREGLAELSALSFDIFGPRNERFETGKAARGRLIERIAALLQAEGALQPGSKGAQLAGNGDGWSILSHLWPGVSTSLHAAASALYLFAAHPEQWDLVRARPGLIGAAVQEVLRMHSPVLSFTRRATRDADIAGVTVPEGSLVAMLYACANRDESQFPDADAFKVERDPADHLAFGWGAHRCVGRHLALREAHALITELVPRVRRLTLAAEPVWTVNQTPHGLARCDITLTNA